MLTKTCLLTLGLCTVAAPAVAHEYRHGDVSIDHPWSRPTPPGTPVGVGYMALHNHGEELVILVAGDSPVAGRVSLHESRTEDGLMQMQPLTEGLSIPPGETVVLQPHGYHLMLESLQRPLTAGEKIPLTLRFRRHEPIDVQLQVEQMDKMPSMDHSSH